MKIDYLSIDDIREYEGNPRNNDAAVDYVAESIEKYGFKNPIIIDRNYVIIAGHTRYKAAIQLGLDKVPCIVAGDLSEEQIKAFRLADNKVAEAAEWDMNLLLDELSGLDCGEGLTGFEDWELENIMNPFNEDSLSDFFEPAEPKEKEPERLKCPCCGEWFEI